MAGLNVPPPMDIPPSQNIVEISIIDTTTYMTGFPASDFVEPDIAGITVKKDVATILQENGQNLEDVGAIIWSHWHFDHVGNPRTFPNTTDLIVGPGFKSNFIPSYPTIPSSQLDERAWEDRDMHEIDFSGPKGLKIGDFEAYDFYGDGSFFLLHSPGHAIGHMSALARTTADPPTFILLGGDIAHHCGEFRPSRYIPLPDIITPSPISHRAGAVLGDCFKPCIRSAAETNRSLTQLWKADGIMSGCRRKKVSTS
ncbi:Metallo-beta-lactamase superprotein [Pyrenophora tritici-repentis]|nr:Metallo-beta-lactamase superprotein [Pyrenophora tritici-repentis]